MNDTVIHSQDLRSSLGETLDGYKAYSYKVPYALSEYVDNSTASYFINKDRLKNIFGQNYKLKIKINYYPNEGLHGSLEIIDNAYGMDRETLNNALKIAKKPIITGGRNEYGMGLKTSSSWFGEVWEVETQRPDSDTFLHSRIDIPELIKNGNFLVSINESSRTYPGYSTRIKISSLRRKITLKDFKTLKNELGSIYRRDIQNGDIEIYVNNEKCFFEEIEILDTTKLPSLKNIENRIWKKDFKDFIEFENQKLEISGFVALRDGGEERRKKYGISAYDETGFSLFRLNRIIEGGPKMNFKPKEIFGSTNSFISLRLFGEINMDNFPVTQAKNQFDWEYNGLKDLFIEKIKEICEKDKFIYTANNFREGVGKISQIAIKNLADNLINQLPEKYINEDSSLEIDKDNLILIDISEKRGYEIPIGIKGTRYLLKVFFVSDPSIDLYTFNSEASKESYGNVTLKVTINEAFPLFSKLNIDERFMDILHKIIVILALSEKISMSIGEPKNNYFLIPHKKIREEFNSILNILNENSDQDFFSKHI